MSVGADLWVGVEGWLRWSAHPFGGAVCSYHAQYPAFAPSTSEVAVTFWPFYILLFILYFIVILFSPLSFLCILLLEEMCVQVQELQQTVPGPRAQPISILPTFLYLVLKNPSYIISIL